MDEMNGMDIIQSLRSKWIIFTLLGDALVSAGGGFVFDMFTHQLFGWSQLWGIVYGGVIFIALLLIRRTWLVKETAVAQLLNQTYPQLEESAHLLRSEEHTSELQSR